MKKKGSVSEVLYIGMGKFVVFQNLNCTSLFLQDVDGCRRTQEGCLQRWSVHFKTSLFLFW